MITFTFEYIVLGVSLNLSSMELSKIVRRVYSETGIGEPFPVTYHEHILRLDTQEQSANKCLQIVNVCDEHLNLLDIVVQDSNELVAVGHPCEAKYDSRIGNLSGASREEPSPFGIFHQRYIIEKIDEKGELMELVTDFNSFGDIVSEIVRIAETGEHRKEVVYTNEYNSMNQIIRQVRVDKMRGAKQLTTWDYHWAEPAEEEADIFDFKVFFRGEQPYQAPVGGTNSPSLSNV